MHRAWQIEDIHILILERLRQQDLAHLAQTCKELWYPAVSFLWRDLKSLEPFFCCLPIMEKGRKLIAADLIRMYHYSAIVQTLHIEGSKNAPINVPEQFRRPWDPRQQNWYLFWHDIGTLRSHRNFLPNLRSLSFINVHEKVLVPFINISGAKLRSFCAKYLHDRQISRVLLKLLEQLQDPTKLEHISIRESEPGLIPERIYQLSPIKSLEIEAIDKGLTWTGAIFENYPINPAIFDKSAIQKLSLSLSRDWYPGPDILLQKSLRSLQSLSLNLLPPRDGDCDDQNCIRENGWICPDAAAEAYPWDSRIDEIIFLQNHPQNKGSNDRKSPAEFFQKLDDPQLEELVLRFPTGSTTEPMFLEVIKGATDNCRLGNLERLTLAGSGNRRCYLRPDFTLEISAFINAMNLLLPLPQLRYLELSLSHEFLRGTQLDMGLYEKIARGLPSLEVLSLGSEELDPETLPGLTSRSTRTLLDEFAVSGAGFALRPPEDSVSSREYQPAEPGSESDIEHG
ncbi:hypothetical protein BT63DRAFT_418578 [Microthyrium microscopicum]|uniref:F-box domain-containing protein n=1 Tax=Microthyrium microscopicum TaxID=703497 RepID=A0A6A6TXU6_9PEZI|nr:hypothetical protein BT63DRAFT_418578 [Microthyrium microscopicum]